MAREYTKIKHLLPEIKKMREKGHTNREIGIYLGFKESQVKKLLERTRAKERKSLQESQPPKRRGRPRKTPITTQREMELEINRLKMENELLRNFLQSIGRR